MSTNYTQNYSLCQWEPQDKVLRTDFNDDNIKLDAALTELREELGAVRALAETAYTTRFPQVLAGSYTGDGKEMQHINLGFRPKAVFVLKSLPQLSLETSYTKYLYGGLATRENLSGADPKRWDNFAAVMVTSTGFRVGQHDERQGSYSPNVNMQGVIYNYIAIR